MAISSRGASSSSLTISWPRRAVVAQCTLRSDSPRSYSRTECRSKPDGRRSSSRRPSWALAPLSEKSRASVDESRVDDERAARCDVDLGAREPERVLDRARAPPRTRSGRAARARARRCLGMRRGGHAAAASRARRGAPARSLIDERRRRHGCLRPRLERRPRRPRPRPPRRGRPRRRRSAIGPAASRTHATRRERREHEPGRRPGTASRAEEPGRRRTSRGRGASDRACRAVIEARRGPASVDRLLHDLGRREAGRAGLGREDQRGARARGLRPP